jgi:IS1 family transposase
MNKLSKEKKRRVIAALVEGNSIRSTERMFGVHRDTIMRLLVRVGRGCEKLMDEKMRDLDCRAIQADEIWTYVGKKQRQLTKEDKVFRPELGDQWVFVAIDPETKLVPTWIIGKRDLVNATAFMKDLARRLNGSRTQLTTDAFIPYATAVEWAFGKRVDYAQLMKIYESAPADAGRYSPPRVAGIRKEAIIGDPNPKNIGTSFVERQNLTMRMQMRRFTRLTNAFSKKLENLKAALALHFAHYNFVRVHRSLRVTPAIEAGITDHIWSIDDLLALEESAGAA